MTAKGQNLITVLDAGSQTVRVLVAEVADGVLRYRGHGTAPAQGMRRGVVAEMGPAIAAVDKAALAAEQATKAPIETTVAGVGGPHVEGMNLEGGIAMGSRLRDITAEDVRSAIASARNVPLAGDREVLHLLPQEFMLDGQAGILDPVGMVGNEMRVRVQQVICSASAVQSLVTCANKSGLEVTDTIYEGLAAAEATLSNDERALGVCIADIGAHTTEIAVYFEGAVQHVAVLPIGGDHFSNDLAVGLRISIEEAEQLKKSSGHSVVTSVPQLSEIEIGGDLSLGGRPARMVKQRLLAEILEPRARELVTMLRDNLRAANVIGALGAGCVLTGGAAQLPGMLDHAESLLYVPARVGMPVPLSRMPSELSKPEFAAAIGMVLYTHRNQSRKAAEERGLRHKLRNIFAETF